MTARERSPWAPTIADHVWSIDVAGVESDPFFQPTTARMHQTLRVTAAMEK
jgi:hypothetical protein